MKFAPSLLLAPLGMPTCDIVVRNGLVVDGTGQTTAFVADVAITDGLIVAVGPDIRCSIYCVLPSCARVHRSL